MDASVTSATESSTGSSLVQGAATSAPAATKWRRWWRLRAPWLLLGLLFGLVALAAARLPPLRTDLSHPASPGTPAWWIEPPEVNPTARLPIIARDLLAVAIAPDGRTALAVGVLGTV